MGPQANLVLTKPAVMISVTAEVYKGQVPA